jgi:lysophospholipase L1-like esterase
MYIGNKRVLGVRVVEMGEAGTNVDIKQETGDSESAVMSQKATTITIDKNGILNKRTESLEVETTLAGIYSNNGSLVAGDDKYMHTDFISVSGYTRAICTGSISSNYCLLAFFDSEYNFLPDVSVCGLTPNAVLNVSIDIPANASYCVMSHYVVQPSFQQGVLRLTRELSNEEKATARENIGAIGTTKTTEFSATLAGTYHSSGWSSVANAWHTPFVSVKGYKKAVCHSKMGVNYYQLAFFDSDYTIIPEVSVLGKDNFTTLEVDIPQGAIYCMMFRYGTDSEHAFLRMVADEITVRCDVEQTLTEEEKARARENIGAAVNTNSISHIEVTTTEAGILNSKGTFSDFNDDTCWNTGYVLLEGYNKLYCRGRLSNGYYLLAFFDSGHTLLPDISILGTNADSDNVVEMDIPTGATYCMLNHYSGTNMKEGILRLTVDTFDSFFVGSSLKGKTINALGDSITSESFTSPTWWRIISERTGASFNNYGISGARIAVSQDRTDSFVEREATLDDNADCVIVMGGTNDHSTTRGSWDSTDTTTLYGALNVLIENMLKRFAGKPILFCTPIHIANSVGSDMPNPNALLTEKTDSDTLSLQLRAEAIKAKCAQFGIPCLDLYSGSGINGIDENRVYYRKNDIYHPSEIGMKRMANIIQAELEKLNTIEL